MWTAIATIIAAVIGVAVAASTNASNQRSIQATNEANAESVKATNDANLQAVRETNAANVEQANIAYQRSLPVNQVNALMQAGMSRAGALNKLSGGGVYTPPALATASMQSSTQQPMHYDYSGIAQAMEKLSDIPSNVQQQKIVDQQLADLKQQADIRQKEELRKQEVHNLDMWQKHYGKNTAELLDAFSSKVVQTAAEKDYDLSQAKSSEQIIRALGLSSDPDYKKMPHLARVQLFDAIKSQNEQRIAQEQHDANMQKAAFERAIMNANLKQLAEDYNNSVKEHKTQDKERVVRELSAKLSSMATELGISEQEMRESIDAYRGKDGKLHQKPERSISPIMQNFWNTIFDIIPIGALSDVFFRGLKFGK